jgi:hypothetical protein
LDSNKGVRMDQGVWLTLCDDGYVNVHIGGRPPVMKGKHGKYQEEFCGHVPYNVLNLLTGVRLSHWEPVRWVVPDRFSVEAQHN